MAAARIYGLPSRGTGTADASVWGREGRGWNEPVMALRLRHFLVTGDEN